MTENNEHQDNAETNADPVERAHTTRDIEEQHLLSQDPNFIVRRKLLENPYLDESVLNDLTKDDAVLIRAIASALLDNRLGEQVIKSVRARRILKFRG